VSPSAGYAALDFGHSAGRRVDTTAPENTNEAAVAELHPEGDRMSEPLPADIGPQLRDFMPAGATVEEATTTALGVAIRRGILPPGMRLRQEDLADLLGVSRIPLRDAFRRLEAEGLVKIEGRRGARVAILSADDVFEIYELLILIEARLMKLAVRNIPDDAIDGVLEMSERMDSTAAPDETGRLNRKAFYGELYRWSGRPRMRDLSLRLRDDVHRYHVLNTIDASLHAHAGLRDCIRRRDADGAAAVIRHHFRMSRDDLVGVLRREERERATKSRLRRRRTPRAGSATTDAAAGPVAAGPADWQASPV
jgi:DNA-binding GntR family transcriptional regulator